MPHEKLQNDRSQPTSEYAIGSLSLVNAQSDRLEKLLNDIPKQMSNTGTCLGNRLIDLHPCLPALPKTTPVKGLKGMVAAIGGASRGIGQGIAVRFAIGGAKVAVLGRSDGKITTGPGTLSNVVQQIESVGSEGLAVQCDLTKPEQIEEGIKNIINKWGILDILVNNASALYPFGLEMIDERRFDLMNNVCVKGAYLLTRECIPHMRRGECLNAHVLTVAPAAIADKGWCGQHVCYSGTKIGMGLLTAAWSQEFKHIKFNSIWPCKMVATFAVTNTVQADLSYAVTVAHMADPAYRIVTSNMHTGHFLDEDALRSMGVKDLEPWQVDPATDYSEIYPDFMVRPEEFFGTGRHKGRQVVEYIPLSSASSDVATLKGENLMFVGNDSRLEEVASKAKSLGANVRTAQMTVDVRTIETLVKGKPMDALFIGAAEMSTMGTLEVDADGWQKLFNSNCKGWYYFAQKAMPQIRKSTRPRICSVARLPSCHPKSYLPATPYGVVSTIRGLYVLGVADEYDGLEAYKKAEQKEPLLYCQSNAIWDGSGDTPSAANCLDLLALKDTSMTGVFFAPDIDKIPADQKRVGHLDYDKKVGFVDYTSMWWADMQ
mmetsp:Transcript_4427/g.7411  ORF Transcript_4427/g.7411 Transcript_4427/m.7411 type:complete len:602 (+) Transcript_4427:30-1835(+)|eukprot:CAMPEP_0119317186 /NCGR_PEP_ID=MMETSP1333-20130426/42266_1 /TAXON_ID=418940 /ORGANISM="Scyphosphaera apsteinii, Strain RCC1455" /LENGTH=601 /DNA_ID=CAMNT_0007323049 /DNA_START=30 /DNA_END=1835 /DNA_ORIENTATION=+